MLNTNGKSVDWHADDYAVSLHASQDIIACCRAGKVTGISIIPNMSCFDECIKLFLNEMPALEKIPIVAVHINLMEGSCCCAKEQLPDLVDERGYFKISWVDLVKISMSLRKSAKIKEQLKMEMKAQILLVKKAIPWQKGLRIDSHQHTNMIPIVFKALMEVIEEDKYDIEFIRVAGEPIIPYLRKMSLLFTYKPINVAKNIILNIFAIRARRKLRKRKIENSIFWGLLMTGKMDSKRVNLLLDDFIDYAEKRSKSLEILFHPGTTLPDEITDEYVKRGFVKDHLSADRKVEFKTLMQRKTLAVAINGTQFL